MFENEKQITVEKGLKNVILVELLFPTVLLTFGIYHGLMQVLYRSGLIHRQSVAGIDYYQGLTLHGTINAIVFTTFFAVAFGHVLIRYYLEKEISFKTMFPSCIFKTSLFFGSMMSIGVSKISTTSFISVSAFIALVSDRAKFHKISNRESI